MTKEVPLRLLLAVAAAAVFLTIAGDDDSAFAASNVRLVTSATDGYKAVDCAPSIDGHGPGQFDHIRLENHGDAPQDLTGWVLKSDPEDSQQLPLDAAGTLVPFVDVSEDRVIIVAGPHANGYPDRKVYLWSIGGVLRDSGDPVDYVRLYDAGGNLVDSMDCNGNPVPLQTATPATPTPAPQVGANQPNPESTQQAEQTSANTTTQQNRAATSGQAPVGQGAPAGGSVAGSVGAPNSGVGSLAPVNSNSWPLALGALAVGLVGLISSAALLIRKGVRRH
jgi:hypothetical protein